jgi:hypothetical protein
MAHLLSHVLFSHITAPPTPPLRDKRYAFGGLQPQNSFDVQTFSTPLLPRREPVGLQPAAGSADRSLDLGRGGVGRTR